MKATAIAVVSSADDEIPAPVAIYVEANPVSVLIDDGLRERFFAEIEKKIDEHVPDLTTDKGRKEIAKLARQYASTKTAIDEAGKALNAEANKKINAVDAVRREVRAKLDDMRDRAREPLTKWEEAEEARLAEVERIMVLLRNAPVVLATDTRHSVSNRIAEVEAVPDEPEYVQAKTTALATLRSAHTSLIQMEAEREELARLRAAEEERKREEDDRAAAERQAAEEAARKEREEKAAKEREETAWHRAAAEAEAKAKAAAQAEIDRLAAEKAALEKAEADRVAEERRKAAEEEKRQSNIRHRSAVMKAAKEGLMKQCGLDEETAKTIVTAITQGLIPNVIVRF